MLGLLAALLVATPAAAQAAGVASSANAAEQVPVCGPALVGMASCSSIRLLRQDVNWHGRHLPHAMRGRALLGKHSPEAVLPDASEPTPAGYLPSELQAAYGLTAASASDGATQTVALVDAYDDPNAEADLAVYRSQFGLAACSTANGCFAKVNQTGGTSYPSPNTGWSEEISVDLDMVSAICPHCHILLVEASSPTFGNLGAAEDYAAAHANAVSNSYGAEQFSEETALDSYYTHSGVVITASAGDSGERAEYPASSPFVTAVGGTSLTKAEKTPRGWSETVWSDTGSGCSEYEPEPEWQPHTTTCSHRTVADVSADANPNTGVAVYDSYKETGWLVFGGTSVASPIIASVYALAGEASHFTVTSADSDAAEDLYLDSASLNKVTSGENGTCGTYLCNAADSLASYEGHEYFDYNGPTGNGTPNGIGAFRVAAPPGAPTLSVAPGNGTVHLSWTAPSEGGAPITGYEIYRGTTSGGEALLKTVGDVTSYEDASAHDGTTYYYKVAAVNASGTGADSNEVSALPVSGTWSGTFGASGYDLAAWNGEEDLTQMPAAKVELLEGSRYVWASSTSEERALESPSGLTREAATYYDSSQLRLTLHFTSAYKGELHLYALDWDSTVRRETISVDGQSAVLSSSFHEGVWVSLPIEVKAGETLAITVTREAGANAVLSGIFLGNGGAPPSLPLTSAPQGTWSGSPDTVYGASGYDLAAFNGEEDLTQMPAAKVELLEGSRYVWAGSTSEARALESPSALTREAATYYDSGTLRIRLHFSSAYKGELHLYALDWDSTARRETIAVGGQSAVLSSSFHEGAWVSLSIEVGAGESLTITVTREAGANAVLSGIFLGGAGPVPSLPISTSPEGNWSPAYGASGYDLAAWKGEEDLVEMPSAKVELLAGSRYVWASSTSEERALESPSGPGTREAATYYDSGTLRIGLHFSSAYKGELHLYALDWDSTVRRETISVDGQSAVLSSSFHEGAWVSLPIEVKAGETLTITVTHEAGANAVLSGIFLG
jgi:Fibronectin type III domain